MALALGLGLIALLVLGMWLGRSPLVFAQPGLFASVAGVSLLIGALTVLIAMGRRTAGLVQPASTLQAVRSDQDRLLQAMGRMARIGGWEFNPLTGEGLWTEEVALIHEVDPQALNSKDAGLSFYDGIHRQRIEAAFAAAIKDGTPFDLELQIKTAQGMLKWVHTICKPEIVNQQVVRLQGTIQDISDRNRVEDDLKYFSLIHNMLHELSQLMDRISSVQELYQHICQIVVDVGKFSGSRISEFSVGSVGVVRQMACAGCVKRFSAQIDYVSNQLEQGIAMSNHVKNGELQIVNDISQDKRLSSLVSIATELNVSAAAVFPIKCHDRVVSVLSVYSERKNAFREREISLFQRIIESITRKLELLEEEQNRRVAEQASRESQARFEGIFMHSPVGVLLTGVESGEIIAVNPALLKMLGYSEEDLRSQTVFTLNFWQSRDERRAFINKLRKKSTAQVTKKITTREKNPREILLHLTAVLIELADEKLVLSTIEDLTQSEIAQEVSERHNRLQEQLHHIAMTVPGVICSFRLDKNGNMTIPYVSKDLYELYGIHYTKIGDDLSEMRELLHHEDRGRIRKNIIRSAEGLTVWREDYRIVHPIKGEIWIEGHAVPCLEPDGSVLWNGFLHDVTERKQKEEQLRESEQRFRALFQHSPVAYQALNKDGCYIDVNERVCQIFNCSHEELIGTKFVDFVTPNQRAMFEDCFQKFCRIGRGTTELSIQRRDGSLMEIVLEGQAQRDEQGRFLRMHCILSDITERRQAEQGLRLQSAALKAAANAIVITDPNGVVEWCNPAFTEFSGYLPDEAKGKLLGDLVRSGYQSRSFYKQMWETVMSGRPWHGELINRRKDGSTYHEQMSITPLLDEEKRITHFIAIKQDISNQKRLEAMLLRTQRLESIGRLASGIAHDLNNVLTPMLMAPLMLRAVIDDPMALEVVESIESSARRGAAIIKQLLTFSRGMPGNRIPVRLRSIVREMTKLITQTFPKNISLRTHLERDVWPILGDPVQIHQVLMNLCVNSRDAMPQGGELTLSVEQVVVSESIARLHGVGAGNFSVMSVQDTGIGIAPDDLDRIYDPFFTTKPIGEGTGLGLSTALGIVKSHMGFIQVESQLGKGTAFRIHFPAFESAASPTVAISTEVLPLGRGELVLVVDDEELTRQMVQQVLEQHGYHVLLARNGTEALSLLSAHPELRLVLSDAMMPGMDGPTLLQRAKQQGFHAEFLIMTGLQSQPELQDVMRRYGVPVLDKPFSAAALLQSVQRVLRHKPDSGPPES